MKTYKRICLSEHTVSDDTGKSLTVYRGQEYITSDVRDDGNVTVFAEYWADCPVDIFGGEVVFTKR